MGNSELEALKAQNAALLASIQGKGKGKGKVPLQVSATDIGGAIRQCLGLGWNDWTWSQLFHAISGIYGVSASPMTQAAASAFQKVMRQTYVNPPGNAVASWYPSGVSAKVVEQAYVTTCAQFGIDTKALGRIRAAVSKAQHKGDKRAKGDAAAEAAADASDAAEALDAADVRAGRSEA